MKKAVCLFLSVLLCAVSSACGNVPVPESSAPVDVSSSAVPVSETPEPEAEQTLPPDVPQWPEVEISAVNPVYSHPVLSRDELCSCFSESVFSSYEYNEDLNSLTVLKWESPVVCFLSGDVTEQDTAAVEAFSASLAAVTEFPGFSVSDSEESSNLLVRICDRDEFMAIAASGVNYEESDSYISVSYDEQSGAITDAEICIRSDTIPYVRSSLIQRELLRSLGMFGESLHRSDSLLSPSYIHIPAPSDTDLLLLRILYNNHIACGADSATCMAYVRALCR